MILYPAIDIRGGRAVRLLRGDYEQETVYDADPAQAARRWVTDGAEHLHVVDLDGARSGRPSNLEALREIADLGVPVQAGGGLRDLDAVAAVLDAGAARAVLGTAAILDPQLLEGALAEHGERIVVSIDARGGRVALQGWTESCEAGAGEALADLSARGVSTFVFTPIDVDGTMEGPDSAALRAAAAATESEVIYSGGVGDLDDLRDLAAAGPPNVTGVIVGRALYEERFTVADARAALTG